MEKEKKNSKDLNRWTNKYRHFRNWQIIFGVHRLKKMKISWTCVRKFDYLNSKPEKKVRRDAMLWVWFQLQLHLTAIHSMATFYIPHQCKANYTIITLLHLLFIQRLCMCVYGEQITAMSESTVERWKWSTNGRKKHFLLLIKIIIKKAWVFGLVLNRNHQRLYLISAHRYLFIQSM